VRTTAWDKDLVGGSPRHGAKVSYDELRAAALLEAEGWKTLEKAKDGSALTKRWEAAKISIEKNSQLLRGMVSSGRKLNPDAEILLSNSNILRQGFEETDSVAENAGELPQIEAADGTSLPRAYAAAESYLRTVNCEFDEQSFEQYFTAMQETVPLRMLELWQLQAMTELVLLESLGSFAERMAAAKDATQKAATDVQAEPAQASAMELEAEATQYFVGPTLVTLLESLRRVKGVDWDELFERINAIEQILRRDPCDAYAQMDFESRDTYRRTIAHLAKHSQATEQEVARKALELAGVLHCSPNDRVKERQ